MISLEGNSIGSLNSSLLHGNLKALIAISNHNLCLASLLKFILRYRKCDSLGYGNIYNPVSLTSSSKLCALNRIHQCVRNSTIATLLTKFECILRCKGQNGSLILWIRLNLLRSLVTCRKCQRQCKQQIEKFFHDVKYLVNCFI